MAKPKRLGLVHVYTGDGKGKTTSAVGLGIRAAGHGMSVLMIQFLKGGGHSGEVVHINAFGGEFKVRQFGKPCPYSEEMRRGGMECDNCKDCFLTRKEEREKASEALDLAEKAVQSGKYDMVILDEANNAVNRRIIPLQRVLKLVSSKKPHVELVFTGRNAPKELIEAADYVTLMKRVKHPFTRGIRARYGVDY